MYLTYQYARSSFIQYLQASTLLHLMASLRREEVHFKGEITSVLPFRQYMLLLHKVVTTDDRPFRERARLFDPVVTVLPDGLYLEGFSMNETLYGRLRITPDGLDHIHELHPGTTNVDFSNQFVQALHRIRTTTMTQLHVERESVDMAVGHHTAVMKKVQLPSTWVLGFFSVQASMTLPHHTFHLQKSDIYNILMLNRRNTRERRSAIKLLLTPDKPLVIEFEPWGNRLELTSSVYTGSAPQVIRMWGRKRLQIVRDILPFADQVRLHIYQGGFPVFWEFKTKGVSFILGLSGWSSLSFARPDMILLYDFDVHSMKFRRVESIIKKMRVGSLTRICHASGLQEKDVFSALQHLSFEGKVMYDIGERVFIWRHILEDDHIKPSLPKIGSKRLSKAQDLARRDKVTILSKQVFGINTLLEARVKSSNGTYDVDLILDDKNMILDGSCTCKWFTYNRLRRGPCAHILAVRIHGKLHLRNDEMLTEQRS